MALVGGKELVRVRRENEVLLPGMRVGQRGRGRVRPGESGDLHRDVDGLHETSRLEIKDLEWPTNIIMNGMGPM